MTLPTFINQPAPPPPDTVAQAFA
ncbi:MAG: hypothetical protein RL375_2067, partial [Pseudomonadota bacterium]